MTDGLIAAIYARVSSEQQAEDHTIASQVAALRVRVAEDELLLAAEHEFLDEGYSGATLVRPALERVRDLVARGGIDRLYVHSPDRLARRYAYQALLPDEFHAAGVISVMYGSWSMSSTRSSSRAIAKPWGWAVSAKNAITSCC